MIFLLTPFALAQRGQSRIQDPGSPEAEIQTGTELTRQGRFQEAIPHLLAAQRQASTSYALSFNLALCYVGIEDYPKAIAVLNDLIHDHDSADLENLLAQALIGAGRRDDALSALQHAAERTPHDEKLYLLVADACTGREDFDLGLKVVELGLKNLPQSAKLYYQHGVFLSLLDRFDDAKPDFEQAAKLGAGSGIGYVAAAHEQLFAGNIPEAVRVAREGAHKSKAPLLLGLLGQALLRSGAAPGQPEFNEAQSALEKSVAGRPTDGDAQLALGKIYLLSNKIDKAIQHLEAAGNLEPHNSAVYSNLAAAYRRHGDDDRAQQMLQALAQLNAEQAQKISNAPGERKAGYAQRVPPPL